MKYFLISLALFFFTANHSIAQTKNIDSIAKKNKFDIKPLIIPTALIGYGIIGLENQELKDLNVKIQDKLITDNHSVFRIDDYTRVAPIVSVYGLNALGIKGKHNFKDRSIILGTAFLIMGVTVKGTKKLTEVKRPDSWALNSFPSGHTALAFMGAEFMHQEYKHKSAWYGIAAYTVAAGTGFMRMQNNRHWFTDVVAGAGVGILSTKIAYLLHPFLKRTIFKDKKKANGIVMPFYNGSEYGLGVAMTF